MPDPEWKTVRVRADRHAQITAKAKAEAVSVAEWLDRALASALNVQPRPRRASGVTSAGNVTSSAQAKAGVKPIPRSTERKGK